MKKFIKKIELKPFLISVGLVVFQSSLYFIAKLLQSTPHIIGSAIDDKIKFCNLFTIPYCIWYIMIFIIPYYYHQKDKNTLAKYVSSYIICAICSTIVFIVYPTTVIRPELANDSLLNILTNIVYFVDYPSLNCLPSLHCAVSMLFILTSFTSKKVSNKFKISITLISILIMIATLFVKQHVLIDVITGDILMSIIYLIVNSNKNIVNKTKKLLNL